MSVDPWKDSFAVFPSWTCPRCKNGKLVMTGKAKIEEPEYSKRAHHHDAWEPDWIQEKFIQEFKCSQAQCGELVTAIGSTYHDDNYDPEFGMSYTRTFTPHAIFPAPPIITVPQSTPDDVATEIDLACQHFWSDLGASATRLRKSVETLLDEYGIAKWKAGKGKRQFKKLNERINDFGKKYPDHVDQLHALRLVGNVGAHGDTDRESLLAAFQLYEAVLSELYENKAKKLKKLTDQLIKGKGKLKKPKKRKS